MTDVLRVVELTNEGIGGPVTGRLFAAFGNEVVKGEPPEGSALRRREPLGPDGESLVSVALDADKLSVVVPAANAGRETVAGLVANADVLIVELPRDRRAALGIDPESIRREFPNLVAVYLSALGVAGPGTDYGVELPSDSLLAESFGGLSTMIGDPAERPLSLGGEQTAYSAGVVAFFGAMLALLRRDQGHGGDIVDVSMVDIAAYMDWKSEVGLAIDGFAPTRALSDSGSRLVRAADGWVGVIFQHRHWSAMVEMIGEPEMLDPALQNNATWLSRSEEWWPAIERWVGRYPAKEVYDKAQKFGLPFGWVLSVADVPTDAQLASRGFVRDIAAEDLGRVPSLMAPFQSDKVGWRYGHAPVIGSTSAEEALSSATVAQVSAGRRAGAGPLSGVTVLDFGTITAGAATTRLLADHGATVLKIESLDKPDLFRWWKGSTAFFPSNNLGKLGVAIDLKLGEGRELLARMARGSHLLVENFRVGVPAKLGIDAKALHEANPDLVYISLSSQGQTGPQALNISYGSTLDLLSGLASLTGYTPDEPLWSSNNVNYPDQLVSFFGAALAVYSVRTGIRGATYDLSQREVVGWTLDPQLNEYLTTGEIERASGNRRSGSVPHDSYPCAESDRWFAVACVSDTERDALARCIGSDDAVGRPVEWWEVNQDGVDLRIRSWASERTRDQCVADLTRIDVPAVPVLNAADRAAEQRFVDRAVNLPQLGSKGFPLRFANYAPSLPAAAPELGEHTREVLRDMFGISAEELSRLEESGVIYQWSVEKAPV